MEIHPTFFANALPLYILEGGTFIFSMGYISITT